MKKLLLICAVAATVLAMVACGDDDDDDSTDGGDPRISQIGGVAEAATHAYAATLGEGLLDYVAANIAANCTKEDIKRALAEEPVPTGFKTIKDVSFDGDDKATATVVVITADGDVEQEWSFIREGDESWRIVEIPSLSEEDCAAQ
jgi:hypothetical protein